MKSVTLKENTITTEDIEVYQYGMEMIISTTLNLLIVLFIGSIFHAFFQGILYFLLLATVRTQAGGYHAPTYFRCGLVYCITFFMSLLLVDFLMFFRINSASLMLVLLINTFFIWLYAPVLHNRTMDDHEKEAAKRKAGIRCFIWIFIAEFLFQFKQEIAYYVFSVFILITAFMIIGKRMEEEKWKKAKKREL